MKGLEARLRVMRIDIYGNLQFTRDQLASAPVTPARIPMGTGLVIPVHRRFDEVANPDVSRF